MCGKMKIIVLPLRYFTMHTAITEVKTTLATKVTTMPTASMRKLTPLCSPTEQHKQTTCSSNYVLVRMCVCACTCVDICKHTCVRAYVSARVCKEIENALHLRFNTG